MDQISSQSARTPFPTVQTLISRYLAPLLVMATLITTPVFGAQKPEDSQMFLSGFASYQQQNYVASATSLQEMLKKYPDSPLRDLALFWLSRSYFRIGNQLEAARHLSRFAKENPNSPLMELVDDGLQLLVVRYERGEALPSVGGAGTNTAG